MGKYLVALIAAIGLAFLFFRSDTGAEKKRPLLVYGWSNYFPDDVLQEFTVRTGTPVEMSFITSNEELFAKLRAGSNDYDIIMPSDYMVRQMHRLGMLTALDHSQIPHLSHIDPRFRKFPYDPGLKVSVPFVLGTTGIAINTERVKLSSDDISWDLLLRSPYPRNTSMLDDVREVFAVATLMSGGKYNDHDAASIERAAGKIREAKLKITLFTTEPLNLLEREEIWIAHTYSTHGVLAAQKNPKIKYFIPKEGGTLWTDNLAIPSTSRDHRSAHAFINFLAEPEIAARLARHHRLATPNLSAKKLLRPDEIRPEAYPDDKTMKRLYFMDDLGDSLGMISRLWTEVKAT